MTKFTDNGDEIADRMRYDAEHACPACGGSGHRDDEREQAQPVSVPDGWLRKTLTPVLEGAAAGSSVSMAAGDVLRELRSMLAAAPKAPAGDARDAERIFEAAWRMAANWADNDDILGDIGSPSYIEQRDEAIAKQRVE